METNFSIKNCIKVAIIIILFFDYAKASTISGLELTNIIEEWLQNQGKPANISILEELKYPKCQKSKLLINDISGNSKLIKINCIGENPWQFIVRNKTDIKKKKKLRQKLINIKYLH